MNLLNLSSCLKLITLAALLTACQKPKVDGANELDDPLYKQCPPITLQIPFYYAELRFYRALNFQKEYKVSVQYDSQPSSLDEIGSTCDANWQYRQNWESRLYDLFKVQRASIDQELHLTFVFSGLHKSLGKLVIEEFEDCTLQNASKIYEATDLLLGYTERYSADQCVGYSFSYHPKYIEITN